MSLHSGFVGKGIDIMDEYAKDIGSSKNPRIVVPITHLYLEHVFDLVLEAQWDKMSNAMSGREGYREKLSIIYALKLIDDDRFETLSTINSIRNQFTHSFKPNDTKIISQVSKIHGHAYAENIPWLARYLAGAIDSMSFLCKLIERTNS